MRVGSKVTTSACELSERDKRQTWKGFGQNKEAIDAVRSMNDSMMTSQLEQMKETKMVGGIKQRQEERKHGETPKASGWETSGSKKRWNSTTKKKYHFRA